MHFRIRFKTYLGLFPLFQQGICNGWYHKEVSLVSRVDAYVGIIIHQKFETRSAMVLFSNKTTGYKERLRYICGFISKMFCYIQEGIRNFLGFSIVKISDFMRGIATSQIPEYFAIRQKPNYFGSTAKYPNPKYPTKPEVPKPKIP